LVPNSETAISFFNSRIFHAEKCRAIIMRTFDYFFQGQIF
jgi:hypothetical protein